ncbi:MAG: hypothetical protein Kow00124_24400 [Anaerolineae bacterium]
MHNALVEFIDTVKAERDRIQGFDEATTKQYIIQQVLHILGWDIFRELVPEYPVRDGRVDFALRVDDTSYIFLEAKRVGAELEDVQEQLLRYAFQEGVKLGVLTNGGSWWLYLPLAEGSWSQRRFFAVDLLEQPSTLAAENLIRFLAKSRVMTGEAVHSAEEYRQSRQRQAILESTMPVAWNKIVSTPEELLLDLLIETTESLSGYRADYEMAERFLARYREQFHVPEPRDARRLGVVQTAQPQQRKQTATEFTGTRPTSFALFGTHHPVSTWKEVLFRICDLLYEQDTQLFLASALSLQGRKRPYFSYNPEELRGPEEFRQTGLYVETHQSASSIVMRCRSLIALFGYDPDDLTIETA